MCDAACEHWNVKTDSGQCVPVALERGGTVTVVLAHGAGGSMEHRTVLRLASVLRREGFGVARFNFPYRARGGGPPDRMPVLRACMTAVVESVGGREGGRVEGQLVVGGHSMGGRVASMLAADGELGADGLLLLGYPLHPAGRTSSLRDAHLARIAMPTLCVNGTRDRLCERALMEGVTVPAGWTMRWIEGADHSFDVLKRSGLTAEMVDEALGEVCREWVAGHVGSTGSGR